MFTTQIVKTLKFYPFTKQYHYLIVIIILTTSFLVNVEKVKCSLLNEGQKEVNRELTELKYVWGDALNNPEALGPNGESYPWEKANKIAGRQRIPRSLFDEEPPKLMSPEETRKILLRSFESHHEWEGVRESSLIKKTHRQGRAPSLTSSSQNDIGEGCVPSRLCQTTYNTSAPMYGISLTSGQPVTIVQKFPDLLQQVVYQVCKSEECEVIQGQCVQTYLPYLFLVIPLGPVTLTGQDYVLVESGCTCRPKYARRNDDPPPLPFIQPFNSSKPRENKRF